MAEKGGNFFEGHIEKIVWAIVGLVCFWLLITRVLFSPNYVSYDNKKFGPGDIDPYISKQAELLEYRLNRKPEPGDTYDRNIGKFIAKVDSAIDIDVRLSLPQPPYILSKVSDNRKYCIPLISEVNGVAIEYIRAAAYVPTEKIGEENTYDKAKHKADDIDFVTVESKFDVARLAEDFYESFAGDDIQEEWRDPCLAKPVFAAVQLQKQELLADGSWSDWQIVPRTKIDHRRRMFEVIEEVDELPPGGIEVRMIQFDESGMRTDLLQPEAYRIASAKEEWFPPSLHKKFVKVQGEIEAQEMREAREAERKKFEEERAKREEARTRRDETRLGQRGRTPAARARPGGRGTGGEFGGIGGIGQLLGSMSPGRGRTPIGGRSRSNRRSDSSARRRELEERRRENERLAGSREAPKKTSIDDIHKELDEILITEKMDLVKMRELVFWAHDDTVEPEKSYRYRIRLGVFNPIAGTDQFGEECKSLKNNAILWSEFSDVTETVEIPERLYFFCRDKHEAGKTVTVTVCRYVLGYWYSKDFTVKQGEVIGKVVKPEVARDEKEKDVTVPKTIDYATGAVLVDVIPVSDWLGATLLRPRHYFDMLYSFDGTDIEHMPTKPEYWAKELQVQFNEIKKSEKEPKEPLRVWSSRPSRVGRRIIPAEGKPEEFKGPMGLGGLLDMLKQRR